MKIQRTRGKYFIEEDDFWRSRRHHGETSSISGQSKWDLLRTKWRWGRCSSKYFDLFVISVPIHQCCTLTSLRLLLVTLIPGTSCISKIYCTAHKICSDPKHKALDNGSLVQKTVYIMQISVRNTVVIHNSKKSRHLVNNKTGSLEVSISHKNIYRFINTKLKLPGVNATIQFNELCKIKNLTSEYINITHGIQNLQGIQWQMFYLSREVNYYMPIVQFNTHKPEYIHNMQALIMNYWF